MRQKSVLVAVVEETAGGSKIIKMGALLRELETLVLLDRVADVAMGDSVSPAGTCETYDVSESFLWRLSLAGTCAVSYTHLTLPTRFAV